VQDRVRYVALLMGQGGYVPASAQATWSRRFGDCKAKTALLLALLKGLGIEAEPVLVNVGLGDVVSDRLPALSLFNHVLVRAHISGKYYWLDGTRTGDSDLDRIDVPDFGWVLPLVANATLVHLVPPPRNRPDFETIAEIDASNGIYTAAKASVEEILRRDYAVALNNALTAITPSQQQEFFAKLWQKDFDLITPGQTSFSFDKQTGELRLSMKGEAKLDWSDGYFHVPNSSVGFKPNFDRRPGPFHDAPISVAYPMFTKAVTVIRMPHGFFAPEHAPITPATETLAGTEYRRTPTESGDALTVETSTRSLVPEIPYKQALADAQRLKVLADEDVSLRVPRTYKLTQADIDSTKKDEITSTTDLVTRGNLLLDAAKPELAISLLTKAISNDPKNVTAIADRAISYFWAKNLEAAEKDLASAEAIEPDNAIVLRTRGIMAESKGDCSKAVGFYTRSLVKEPENGFALGHRAMCEYNLGKDSEALSDSELALKSMPSWMNLRLLRANVLLHSNKREAVEQEAQLLIKDNPQSDFAYVAAAKIYSRLGEQEKAMQTFDRALAVKPLAYIYLNREQIRPHDDFKARLLDLDAGLKLEPDNSDLLVEKARLLSSTGDYKGALALLDRLKPEPDDLYAQMQRAVVLYKAGRLAEARPILDSLRAKAKTPMELNNLCWSKATADIALDSAVHDCEDALKLNPDAGQILDSLGMALLKSGKLDEALAAYDKAVAKSTGAASFMGRAFVYVRKGDSAHAMADRAQALKLDPKIEERFADYGLKFDQSSSSAHAAQ
jgi:tetratricopeptide (TPR) repeat protein